MKTMTTYDFYQYLSDKLKTLLPDEDISKILKNGYIDRKSRKAVSVYQAPSTRSDASLCMGGIDCTTVRFIPVNILIRWGDDARISDDVCVQIYEMMLNEGQNFVSHDVKIAYIQLLDAQPIVLGRDEMNVCENSIRANIYYYT